MDSPRPLFVIGYTDPCDSWHLAESAINLTFPLKISSNLFPNLKYFQPKYTPFEDKTHSSDENSPINEPVIYLLLISLPSLKTYKSNIRPVIQSWLDKLSFIKNGKILLIHSQSKIDSSHSKNIDKIRHDVSTLYHNKCHLFLLESNTIKPLNKFTDLVIACLLERRKKLENSYNNIWNSLLENTDSNLKFNQIFTSCENLASFYLQISEFTEALNLYRRLSATHNEDSATSLITLFPAKSQPDDFNQPTIIFSDHLYKYVGELTTGPKSYLFFSQYRLGMMLLLHRIIGTNNNMDYLKDCLDFITHTRRIITNTPNISHKWFINTILEIADNCNTLLAEGLVSTENSLPRNISLDANAVSREKLPRENFLTSEDQTEGCGNSKTLLQQHKIIGLLYSHAYFISKVESDKLTGKLLESAITHFNMGGYARFAKALSLLDSFRGSATDKWLSLWDLSYPPFVSLDLLSHDMPKAPVPTQIYNGHTDMPIPLQFYCPLTADEPMPLPVKIIFILVSTDITIIKTNSLTPIDGKPNRFKPRESIVLPEGTWQLASIVHNNRVLFPRNIALPENTYLENTYLENTLSCKKSLPDKYVIRVTCPLSLTAYSDRSMEGLDSSYWVCGYGNYIELNSMIDSFEIIFPIPVILIDRTSSTHITDSESTSYKFTVGSYNFLVLCHTIEVFQGHIVMKSCNYPTTIESEIIIYPLFEINVRYMSESLCQLEITSHKSVDVQLQTGRINNDESGGFARENPTETKKFPPLMPFVPFYIVFDTPPNNNMLIITWENKTFNISLMDLLEKKIKKPDKLDIEINANPLIYKGEPFAININGSKNEAIACEFEDNDNFILCGWNRKVFLEVEPKLLQLQVHFIPIGKHGLNAFPPLTVTSYPSNQLLGILRKDVYILPSKNATFNITEL